MRTFLYILLTITTSNAWAWECDEPEGVITRTGDIEAKFDCAESLCIVQLSAPHNVEDRAFSGFSLTIQKGDELIVSTSLNKSQMGSIFNTQIILNENSFEGVKVSASYINFMYGCTVRTDIDLYKEYNTTLKGDAQKSRAP